MLAAGSQPAECTLVFGSRPAGRQLAAGSRQFTQLDEAFDGRADDPGGTPTLELGTEPIKVIGDAATMRIAKQDNHRIDAHLGRRQLASDASDEVIGIQVEPTRLLNHAASSRRLMSRWARASQSTV